MKESTLTAMGVAALLLLSLTIITSSHPKDDTDSRDTRSGMVLYRDALTGCEYLSRAGLFAFFTGGTLTPRLGADGKPVCRPGAVK